MDALRLTLDDADATRGAGRALGAVLAGGDVIALVGDLGAGKTTLVGGVVDGAGGDPGQVASPTFALIHEYGGPLTIVHVDLYRLEDERELDQLGLDEQWGMPDRAALVEWADRFGHRLPPDRLEVTLAHDGDGRLLAARAAGPRSDRLLAAWMRAVAAAGPAAGRSG